MQTFLERIENLTIPEPNTGCWIWLGTTMKRSDGRRAAMKYKGEQVAAARPIYRELRGEIPAGMCVCHKCDTPLCVNPDHLWLGTHSDNIRDMYAKNRAGGRSAGVLYGKGVSQMTNGKWRAYAYVERRQISLGSYHSIEAAVAARAAFYA